MFSSDKKIILSERINIEGTKFLIEITQFKKPSYIEPSYFKFKVYKGFCINYFRDIVFCEEVFDFMGYSIQSVPDYKRMLDLFVQRVKRKMEAIEESEIRQLNGLKVLKDYFSTFK